MTFLTTPERASALGTCNCTVNYGSYANQCNGNNGGCGSNCNGNCNGNCTTLRVCVTPTGAKLTINGVGAAS